ncbi:hypothetical protein ACF3NA_00720 [Alkanindiges sp. WGS2144]|uniref:hypothetical protein n=1 Tax=Alkanindiges sp. WGS2144 TaxID=3366808 RepID=UPI003751207F
MLDTVTSSAACAVRELASLTSGAVREVMLEISETARELALTIAVLFARPEYPEGKPRTDAAAG